MFVSTKDLTHATLFDGRLMKALGPVVYELSEMAATNTRKDAAGIKAARIGDGVVEV